MLGSNSSPYGDWPQKGEIDIMETYSPGSQIVGGAAHFGTTFPLNQYESRDAVGDYDYDDGECSSRGAWWCWWAWVWAHEHAATRPYHYQQRTAHGELVSE